MEIKLMAERIKTAIRSQSQMANFLIEMEIEEMPLSEMLELQKELLQQGIKNYLFLEMIIKQRKNNGQQAITG
jgi:hypothetical protein